MPNHFPERPNGLAVASILVIEDDDAVRGLFRAILEPVGYLIAEASTGWEGIRRFRESPTDLVMTDMDMPHGDGADVIRQLRADYPAVRILAVSGSKGVDEIRSEAQQLGADAMLPKPVGVDELRAAVALSLQGRRETRLP
jgi:CheY-like chemotaxis protein